MGVTLSGRQFLRPELLGNIQIALQTAGLAPTGLKLEITVPAEQLEASLLASLPGPIRKAA